MESYSWLRLKHAIATNTRAILAASLVVVLVSGAVVLTGLVAPPIDGSPLATQDDAAPTLHATSVEQHASVTVTEATTAYDRMETVRDASVYPLANATDPEVTARARADNAELTNLTVTLTYAAREGTGESEPFYTNETVLATAEPNGSVAAASTTVPIAAVLDRIASLEAEFGSGVTVSATVTATATYEYEVARGQVVRGTETVTGDVERVGNLYRFPTGEQRTTQRTGTGTGTGGDAAPIVNWLFLVAGFSALFLGGLTAGVTRVVDTPAVARKLQWQRFREWVTEIESYTPQGEVNTVEVTGLGDLVNLAIDTNRRVLYHSQVGEYIVVEDDVMYKFSPDSEENTGSTELFGLREEDLATTEFPTIEELPSGGPGDAEGPEPGE